MTTTNETRLPSLLPEQGEGGLTAVRRGWNESDDIAAAAKGLKGTIARSEAHRRAIVSIPDVWAQADQVAHGLYVTQDPRMIGEWRGFLALWGLAGVRKLPVSFEHLHLPGLVRRNRRAASSEESQSFAAIAHEMLPQVSLLGNGAEHWESLGLMRMAGQPIALVAPNCLIVPGKNYADVLNGRPIPWFDTDTKRLVDPTSTSRVSKEILQPLGYAIERLLTHVRDQFQNDPTASQFRNGLEGQLDDYLVAIRKATDELPPFKDQTVNELTDNSQAPMDVELFKLFHKRYTLSSQSESMAAHVPPRDGFGTAAFKGGVLATDNLAQVFGKPRDSIFVWRGRALAEVRGSDAALTEVTNEAQASGYIVLTEETLFLPHLQRVAEGATFTRHPSGAERFVLPLNPAILFFLSPGDLRKRLSIEETGDAVSVKLTLPVVKDDGGKENFTLERTYSGDAILAPRDRPVGPSVWPDFKAASGDDGKPWWRHYMLYSMSETDHTLIPDIGLAADDLLDYLTSSQGDAAQRVADATRGLRSWRDGDRLLMRGPSDIRRLQMLESPPEAVVCQASIETDGPDNPIEDVGLILMPELIDAPNPRSGEQQHAVGIDFGTTNTTVYYRRPEGQPECLVFNPHLAGPFTPPRMVDSDAQTHSIDFLPPEQMLDDGDIPMPFQTLLASRSLSEDIARTALMTDYIFFNNDIDTTTNAVAGLIKQIQIDTNLKWDMEAEESKKEKIRLFLGQVVRQTMAELGSQGIPPSRVDWSFSFPKAFSESELNAFRQLCPRAVEIAATTRPSAQGKSQAAHWTNTGVVKVDRDESEASARYFYALEKAFPNALTVTFDIGGGTTDISLWQSNSLIWRSSVKLAGRAILIDFLMQNFEFVTLALRGHKQTLNNMQNRWKSLGAKKDARAQAFLEAVVNSKVYQSGFAREHDVLASTNLYRQLETSAEFALAGLLYFVGRQIEKLGASGVLDLSKDTCRLCFGGRGSRVFSQVIGDPARHRLTSMFQETAGLSQKPASIQFSEQPKHEVAYGLLAEFEGAASLTIDNDSLPASIIGETLMVGDGEQGWDATYIDLPEENWRLDDLPEFKRMVGLYERSLGREVPFDEEFYRDLIDKVRGRFSDLEHEAREARKQYAKTGRLGQQASAIEPVLIVALRQALSKMRADGLEIQKDQ